MNWVHQFGSDFSYTYHGLLLVLIIKTNFLKEGYLTFTLKENLDLQLQRFEMENPLWENRQTFSVLSSKQNTIFLIAKSVRHALFFVSLSRFLYSEFVTFRMCFT